MGGFSSVALRLKQIATPSTPAAGENKLYTKSDNKLYLKSSNGVEALVGPNPYSSGELMFGHATELRETFGDVPDGAAPSRAKSGQTMVNHQYFAGAAPYVRSGFLSTTTPNSAEAGSYRITELDGPVVRCGARWAFTPYTAAGGLLCLSIQNTSIVNYVNAVPVSPMHLQITPTTWSIDVNAEDGTPIETVFSGFFEVPLVADSTTLHSVEVVLDRDKKTCHLTLPNGFIVSLEDARFALPGNFVYVEPFKTAGSLSTKTNALVKEWWADSKQYEAVVKARATYNSPHWAPTLASGWSNMGGALFPAAYHRKGDRGYLEGVVKSTGSAFSKIFDLPVGYRPAADLNFAVSANAAFGFLEVRSTGVVFYVSGSTNQVSLSCDFPLKN